MNKKTKFFYKQTKKKDYYCYFDSKWLFNKREGKTVQCTKLPPCVRSKEGPERKDLLNTTLSCISARGVYIVFTA